MKGRSSNVFHGSCGMVLSKPREFLQFVSFQQSGERGDVHCGVVSSSKPTKRYYAKFKERATAAVNSERFSDKRELVVWRMNTQLRNRWWATSTSADTPC